MISRLAKLKVAGMAVALAAPSTMPLEARSEATVGIVMAVQGSTSPEFRQFEEIETGSSLRLGADAKLTFLHYEACTLVTLIGPGGVNVEKGGWKIEGAKIESEENNRCPRRYQLNNAKSENEPVVGGVVLRSGQPPIRVGPRPTILLTGAGAHDLVSAQILESTGRHAGDARLKHGHLTLAQHDPPLIMDNQYFLVLQSLQGEERHEIRLAVVAQTWPDEITILHVP